MSKFAVIGSNSFSGADLVDLLVEDESNEIIGLSRSEEKSSLFLPYKRFGGSRFSFHQLNINDDMEKIAEVLDEFRPEYVINYAAQGEVGTSWKYPEQWFETNAVGTAKLGNFLKDCKWLKRYVHISTPEVYGTCEGTVTEDAPMNPSTPSAASKAAGDMFLSTLVKQYEFPLVLIRSTNVYGAYQQLYRIIPRTIIYLKSGRTLKLHGGGRAVKSYIHIRDVSHGILAAALKGRMGEIYHLSPTEEISIKALVQKICDIMDFDYQLFVEDVPERPGQDARYYIDSTKARQEFSWEPSINYDEGIGSAIKWIEDNWEQIKNEPLDYIHQP